MFDWIVIGGIVQGVVLVGFLLSTERGNRKANLFLSLYLLILCCYILFPTLTRNYGWAVPYFFATSLPLLFLIGPLLHIYILRLFNKHISYKTVILHFIVPLAGFFYQFTLYTASSEDKIEMYHYVQEFGVPLKYLIVWDFACLHVLLYTGYVFIKVYNYNRNLKNTYSKLDKINLNWLSNFSFANLILWTLFLVANVLILLKIEINPLGIIDQVFNAILSIFIFYLGYVAMTRPEIFPSSSVVPVFNKPELLKDNSEKRKREIKTLEGIMENEKPYLISELTLNELATISGISARKLTSIINEEYKLNFYNYINKYRIEDFKKKIVDKNNDQFTILSIAEDSGFNSKSTFNEVFKKYEKITPSEYKKRMRTQIE